MKKRKIKLEFFDYPGCLIASNTAVYNNGYYEEVARISHAGNITWAVDKRSIPDDSVSLIKCFAEKNRERFTKKFEIETATPRRAMQFYYAIMLECLNTSEWLEHIKVCEKMTIEDRIQVLKPLYFQKN